MMQWLNYRVRVTLHDTRVMVGTFMAFDRHMNVVLADCEEFRTIKPRSEETEKEIKRMLGLVLLRGENIITIFPEAPPVREKKHLEAKSDGPGRSIPVSRGTLPVSTGGLTAPVGLTAPMRGVGGPAPVQSASASTGGLLPPLPKPASAPRSTGGLYPPGPR
jgi:small nuclear ribonucleoprotein (snRNP)-like protein